MLSQYTVLKLENPLLPAGPNPATYFAYNNNNNNNQNNNNNNNTYINNDNSNKEPPNPMVLERPTGSHLMGSSCMLGVHHNHQWSRQAQPIIMV